MTAEIVRHINVILCTAAFAGLLWRLIGRWMISFRLAHYVVALFALLELIIALGTARRAELGGPLNEAQFFIMAHAVATLAVVVYWPRLLEPNSPKQGTERVR